ncbi:hypothetical protein L198_07712 [Cryptococcus wingfieldii CBS 7118]|uniref:Tyrosine specific protein phosphatases domain-containing protein n=1 Tax=Cryptococcus wingfieldii CBS 7118 TaxID=1295528 RepID=A0A1E3I1J0_9TREE|nr:hypothetical protein L198_07712 [Cryptococcus wingfieldii CBS 7118]ODN82490.1 hypothetical protein L198_07712 [Cryptococcus wingfieldii CBS 7118]
MSRTAAPTPPPQTYFPQKTATPSMRHNAHSTSSAHFARHGHGHGHHPHSFARRKVKNLPSGTFRKTPEDSSERDAGDAEGRREEDLHGPQSIASSSSSNQSSQSSIPSSNDSLSRSSTPLTSASMASIISQTPSTLLTPVSSDSEPCIIDADDISLHSDSALSPGYLGGQDLGQMFLGGEGGKPSWVGKMVMGVVNTGRGFIRDEKRRGSFTGRRSSSQTGTSTPSSLTTTLPLRLPSPSSQLAQPSAQPAHPAAQSTGVKEEEKDKRQREWIDSENRRIHECARLCSQWPQSGYNMTKHGPKGANIPYQPQSFCNPHYVAMVMQRQAELEQQLCTTSSTFFSCQHQPQHHRGEHESDDETDTSVSEPSGSGSAESSPVGSVLFGSAARFEGARECKEEYEKKRAEELREAMASSLLCCRHSNASLPSLPHETDMTMQLDEPLSNAHSRSLHLPQRQTRQPTRVRAQSCGAKRPMVGQGQQGEEEKRRKVEEDEEDVKMVVEEAVDNGVILSPSESAKASVSAAAAAQGGRMSASVPDLSKAHAENPTPAAVFGMVVKTSESHPIIVSPFFPSELLEILSRNVVGQVEEGKRMMLGSRIDVPSLLLGFAPPSASAPIPSPLQSSFRDLHLSPPSPSPSSSVSSPQTQTKPQTLGNLLLSSCPGKRLRMDAPSKGRGPVCRDLATDLRRIKGEGVGALVCCLDDEELALLGVPWETYRDVAVGTGLDVIRLPMPDGFTMVSMELFDSQVALIAQKYTLQGINVLVHCRGGIGRAGMTACAWAIKMGFVQPHPSLTIVEEAARRHAAHTARSAPAPALNPSSTSTSSSSYTPNSSSSTAPAPAATIPAELEHQITMSIVERVIAMIRCRRGLKAIESYEQVQFLRRYVGWLREKA